MRILVLALLLVGCGNVTVSHPSPSDADGDTDTTSPTGTEPDADTDTDTDTDSATDTRPSWGLCDADLSTLDCYDSAGLDSCDLAFNCAADASTQAEVEGCFYLAAPDNCTFAVDLARCMCASCLAECRDVTAMCRACLCTYCDYVGMSCFNVCS